MKIRTGIGYDIHQLVTHRTLMLAGIEIASDLGLLGHSDADVVLHALSDSILGALALPDIGNFFPDTDINNKNLSSKNILIFAKNRIEERKYLISNIDIVIIAEYPKLLPYVDQMKNSISSILEIAADEVGIKIKTNEGLDAIGQKKAIAAFANVLLVGA